jgi:peptidyl-prolyl cis-trans isomerase C
MARSWVREPLLHFLLAGAAIFVVTSLWPDGGDERLITVNRQQLEDFLRARAQLDDRGQFEAYYQAMPREQRATLIRRVAQDEALYREGLAIGLDRADPVVRQRVIQQMRQLLSLTGCVAAGHRPPRPPRTANAFSTRRS